eukprot:Seg583.4_Seg583.2 transcript_id=Seg583.4_Seg583.2/GoldUCD/mRNA.D3Y31 product="hypothetical protein" protein_id=Seg583.4_Seg583.2/GoldUCD/D3Y31
MIFSRSILIYICFNALEIKSEILRLPCKSYANFSIIKHDTALQGSVIETLLFLTENQCKSKCLMERRCKSYNKENGGDMKCELNDKTTEDWRDWNVTVVKRPGWTFKSTDYIFPQLGQICEANNPCSDGVLCKDTCELPGYQCHPCKDGETGLRCDETIKFQKKSDGLIEVGSKDNKYASVTVDVPHGKYKIKLIHHSGFLKCSTYYLFKRSNFGCIKEGESDVILIVVTDNQDKILLPKGFLTQAAYSHDGNKSNSKYIIFNDVIELKPGKQLRFWYTEDLDLQIKMRMTIQELRSFMHMQCWSRKSLIFLRMEENFKLVD